MNELAYPHKRLKSDFTYDCPYGHSTTLMLRTYDTENKIKTQPEYTIRLKGIHVKRNQFLILNYLCTQLICMSNLNHSGKPEMKTYSSGYGGSGKSTDIHSNAANVTAATCGP